MSIVKCENGHFYNDEESIYCPYCAGAGLAQPAIIDLNRGGAPAPAYPDLPHTEPIANPYAAVSKTVPLDSAPHHQDICSTQPLEHKTEFIDKDQNSDVFPVRGWLVVIAGKKKGMDFRIRNGNNKIGRSSSNDIHFDFDKTVSEDSACIITYDDRKKNFYITNGNSRNVIRVNDEALRKDIDLKDFDIIEIGETKLVFRSLCCEAFDYPKDGTDAK